MQTSVTGNTLKQASGFTLIEVLLVVVIIGITAFMGVNFINSQSVERHIMSSAARFQAGLTYLCDQAVLENRAYGIEFTTEMTAVLQHQNQQWVWLESQRIDSELEQFSKAVLLNGLTVSLKAEPEQQPHVICQPDGSLSPFELRLWQAGQTEQANQSDEPYYVVRSDGPWRISGAWYGG
jgi:general secretion pathway protein H